MIIRRRSSDASVLLSTALRHHSFWCTNSRELATTILLYHLPHFEIRQLSLPRSISISAGTPSALAMPGKTPRGRDPTGAGGHGAQHQEDDNGTSQGHSAGSAARAQKLRDEAEVSRLALSNFGSMTQRSVLSDKGSASLEKKPKRQVLSRFCRIERESAKTEVMNAAAGIYSLLYAPKGHTNNLHAAGWAISRARSLAWSFVFAVAGVISAVCENEVLWANNRVPSMTSFWLKVVCVILSVAALYFTRNYYRAVIAQERLRGLPLHNGHVSVVNLQATGLFWQAFFDVLCLLPMPIPFLNFEFEFWNDSVNSAAVYQIDVILTVLMFLRIRLFPRFFGECLSGVGTDTARAYGNISRLVMGESFIFKYLITTNLMMVLTLWFTQIVFFAYCLMLFERPMSFNPLAHSKLHEFANCVWCSVITMTIVGYGDVYPQTRLGRATMMVASISALIMVAISTNIVNVLLAMNRAETKCIEVLGIMETRDDVKIKAAELIQSAWRAYSLPAKEGAKRRSKPGRKLLDNDDFCSKVWEFAMASRSFYNDRCAASSDELVLVGECLSTASRTTDSLAGVSESLRKSRQALDSLRAA